MKKIFTLTGILFFFLLALSPLAFKKMDKERINEAIDKSLILLQKNYHTFLENVNGCDSCDHLGLDAVNFALAKEKGFSIQDSVIRKALDRIVNFWRGYHPDPVKANDGTDIVMTGSYGLWALSANHYKPNKTISLIANNILQRQTVNGSWVYPNPGTTLDYYSFSATALAMKAIQNFTPAGLQPIVKERIEHAKTWLMNTVPQTNEERIFQLLGLTWSGGDPVFIKQQAKRLLAKQQPNGGWSQLETLQTDAYATGQSLYALNQSGNLDTDDSAYQKGLLFLLNTRHEDGSWKTLKRAFPGEPYVSSGIWATMAMLLAVK
jgi:hypothetical protein